MRMSNHHIYESYSDILLPIANELSVTLEKYPMTSLDLGLLVLFIFFNIQRFFA